MAEIDYASWLRFLSMPHIRPGESASSDDLADYAGSAWRRTIKNALQFTVLQQVPLLAQFVHFSVEGFVDLDLPTVVHKEHTDAVLAAAASHARFVNDSKISFFRRSAASLTNKGLVCVVSRESESSSPEERADYEVYHVCIETPAVNAPPLSQALHLAETEIEGTPLKAVWFRTVMDIVGVGPSPKLAEFPSSQRNAIPLQIAECFGNTPEAQQHYLMHMAPILLCGHAVFCVPLLFTRDDEARPLDSDRTTGACFFVLKDTPNAADLQGIYLLTRRFCNSIALLFDYAQRQINIQMAENVYAIGHPLKHRLGLVRQTVDTELEALSALRMKAESSQELENAEGWCHRARIAATYAGSTASTMNLLSSLYQHGCNMQFLDQKFFCDAPYLLGRRLRQLLQDLGKAAWNLDVSEADLSNLDRIEVIPGIETAVGLRRLFDPFYDDILFELLMNVNTYGPNGSPQCQIDFQAINLLEGDHHLRFDCITWTNETLQTRFDHVRLVQGEWKRWPTGKDGPTGGLRLLSTQLTLTKTGIMFAKPFERDGRQYFSVAVHLANLRTTQ